MNKEEITQSEFIKDYCDKSDMTEKELNKLGLFAVPCNCGESDCRGWAMITKVNLKTHSKLYLDLKKNE
jgi:hypothetical protein